MPRRRRPPLGRKRRSSRSRIRTGESHLDGGTNGLTVLVVDDVEDNRELYAEWFAHHGFRAECARNGEDAIAKLARLDVDVVVMDLSMPKMDGWEATRRIKANPMTARIPVIVVTGHATPEGLGRARSAGADEICTKPCLPKDLLAIVRRLLGVKA